MRTMVRSKITLLFMSLGMLLAIPAMALADIVHDQVNNVDSNANESINLVEGNTTTVKYWIERVNPTSEDGDGGCNIDNGEQLYIKISSNDAAVANAVAGQADVKELTVGGVKGLYVGPFTDCDNPDTAATREGVKSADIKGLSVGSANFSVTVPSSGTTGTDVNNATVALNTTGSGSYDVTTDGTFTVNVTAANTKPSAPGTPSGTSPNQGAFTLTWTASTDDGKPAGSSVTYTLQHKDSDDTAFSNVATGISSNSYSFTAASPEAEGTWTYRVQASDGSLSSDFSGDSSAIVVDQSRPNAPSANEGTPDYTASNGDKWFKDSATVSFTSNGDPNLADGSAGSGVASVSAAQSRNTSGALNYSGTATDNVGLVSLATTGTVYVDADNPTFGSCPTAGPFLYNSGSQSVGPISASDAHSGLSANSTLSGSVDTSTVGTKTVTFTALDNVGHSVQKQCSYNVRYDYSGVLQPINSDGSSIFKAGSTVPVKFYLTGASAGITDASISLKYAKISNGVAGQETESVSTLTGTTGTLFRYSEGQYIYNWSTKGLSEGTYEIRFVLPDGTVQGTAIISLKK